MARRKGGAPPGIDPDPSDEVLHAKYLDYCSAQIADLLLELPPDEIYVLTENARRKLERDENRFEDLVWMATEGVIERLSLPPFDEWVEAYRSNPESYRKYFLMWDAEALKPE